MSARACLLPLAAALAVLAPAGCGGDDGQSSTISTAATAESTAEASTTSSTTATTDGGETTSGKGTGDGSKGPSHETTIERNVVAVVGSNEAALVCGSLATGRFLREAYGSAEGCRAAIAAQPASEVEVSRVEIDGEAASAIAIPARGPLAGEEIEVTLVLEQGRWKVDTLIADVPAGP